jgi:hypothetical protein
MQSDEKHRDSYTVQDNLQKLIVKNGVGNWDQQIMQPEGERENPQKNSHPSSSRISAFSRINRMITKTAQSKAASQDF